MKSRKPYCRHHTSFFHTARCPISRRLRLPALRAPPSPSTTLSLSPPPTSTTSLLLGVCVALVAVGGSMCTEWRRSDCKSDSTPSFVFNYSSSSVFFSFLFQNRQSWEKKFSYGHNVSVIIRRCRPTHRCRFVLSGAAARCWGLLVIIRSRLLRCVYLSNWQQCIGKSRGVRRWGAESTLVDIYWLCFFFFAFFFFCPLDYRCPATQPPDNSECRN